MVVLKMIKGGVESRHEKMLVNEKDEIFEYNQEDKKNGQTIWIG